MCQKYDVELLSYGANTDKGLRSDRDLNDDELFHMSLIDLQSAHRLGCKIMRAQYMLTPTIFAKLARYAEAYGIKVGIEIHNPETPSSTMVQDYLSVIKEVNSNYLGLIPDFGCFATKPNKPHWDQALQQGAREEVLKEFETMRYNQVPHSEAFTKAMSRQATPAELYVLNGMYGFVTFYKEPDLQGLKAILPYCIHFHGKFHDINENLTEASIPYPQILKVIYDSDFSGCIVAEYEDQSGPSDTMVSRYMKMTQHIMEELKWQR